MVSSAASATSRRVGRRVTRKRSRKTSDETPVFGFWRAHYILAWSHRAHVFSHMLTTHTSNTGGANPISRLLHLHLGTHPGILREACYVTPTLLHQVVSACPRCLSGQLVSKAPAPSTSRAFRPVQRQNRVLVYTARTLNAAGNHIHQSMSIL